MHDSPSAPGNRRASLARLLALADWPLVQSLTQSLSALPHHLLRGPDSGLVMLRGRMGSTGAAFNLGEATATRCSVRLEDDTQGHAYVLGRNGELARRMALCDAAAQSGRHDAALTEIEAALTRNLDEKRAALAARVAPTKVDFFTVVRGDA